MWSASSTPYLTPYKALVLFHIPCESRNSAVVVAVLGFRSSTKQYLPLHDARGLKKGSIPPFMASLFYCMSPLQLYIQLNDPDTEKDRALTRQNSAM